MNTIPETIAAFGLTQSDKATADDLFDLARVIAGHVAPRVAHFRTLHCLLGDSTCLPDFVGTGVYRKSFARRAGLELIRRVFDHDGAAEDYAGLLQVNAMVLLSILDNRPLNTLLAVLQPGQEDTPVFFEDFAGRHKSFPAKTIPNSIHLPGMTLTYTPVRGLDGKIRFELGLLFDSGLHARLHAESREQAIAMLQDWVRRPQTAFNPAANSSKTASPIAV